MDPIFWIPIGVILLIAVGGVYYFGVIVENRSNDD